MYKPDLNSKSMELNDIQSSSETNCGRSKGVVVPKTDNSSNKYQRLVPLVFTTLLKTLGLLGLPVLHPLLCNHVKASPQREETDFSCEQGQGKDWRTRTTNQAFTENEPNWNHTVRSYNEDISHEDISHVSAIEGTKHGQFASADVSQNSLSRQKFENISHENISHENISHENISHEDISHVSAIEGTKHGQFASADVSQNSLSRQMFSHHNGAMHDSPPEANNYLPVKVIEVKKKDGSVQNDVKEMHGESTTDKRSGKQRARLHVNEEWNKERRKIEKHQNGFVGAEGEDVEAARTLPGTPPRTHRTLSATQRTPTGTRQRTPPGTPTLSKERKSGPLHVHANTASTRSTCRRCEAKKVTGRIIAAVIVLLFLANIIRYCSIFLNMDILNGSVVPAVIFMIFFMWTFYLYVMTYYSLRVHLPSFLTLLDAYDRIYSVCIDGTRLGKRLVVLVVCSLVGQVAVSAFLVVGIHTYLPSFRKHLTPFTNLEGIQLYTVSAVFAIVVCACVGIPTSIFVFLHASAYVIRKEFDLVARQFRLLFPPQEKVVWDVVDSLFTNTDKGLKFRDVNGWFSLDLGAQATDNKVARKGCLTYEEEEQGGMLEEVGDTGYRTSFTETRSHAENSRIDGSATMSYAKSSHQRNGAGRKDKVPERQQQKINARSRRTEKTIEVMDSLQSIEEILHKYDFLEAQDDANEQGQPKHAYKIAADASVNRNIQPCNGRVEGRFHSDEVKGQNHSRCDCHGNGSDTQGNTSDPEERNCHDQGHGCEFRKNYSDLRGQPHHGNMGQGHRMEAGEGRRIEEAFDHLHTKHQLLCAILRKSQGCCGHYLAMAFSSGIPMFCIIIYGLSSDALGRDESAFMGFVVVESLLTITQSIIMGIIVNESWWYISIIMGIIVN